MKLHSPKTLFLLALAVFALRMPCARAADDRAATAHAAKVTAGDNVALGKKYTLDPKPNYPNCTDPSDVTKLTDGVYSQGHFWEQKSSTVGWENAYPVTITIDLGTSFPIQGVSYNTAAEPGNVEWPTSILLLVSDDDRSYYYAGNLVDLDKVHGLPKPSGYTTHRYWTDQLNTFGRYVKLMITTHGPYIFVDEIEVRRGPDAPLTRPPEATEITDVNAFFKKCIVAQGIRRRLTNDLAAVRKALTGMPARQDLEASCSAIEGDMAGLPVAAPNTTTVFPVNNLHERIFAVQAAIWRAKGLDAITLWQKNPWDMMSPTELPGPGGAKVGVEMMRNEFRCAAFNISNAGEKVAKLSLSIEGLPGGANPQSITVHDAPFTDTKQGAPVMAALPLANRDAAGYQFEIHPGLTSQVWLTFNSRDVAPGEYKGTILIQPGELRVPVTWKVYPLTFPDQPALHLGGWDYTNTDRPYMGVTAENKEALVRHLREHFVDIPWAWREILSTGEYDRDGHMVKEPDAGKFEKWVQLWPGARNYYVAGVPHKFCGLKMGTPQFEKAVASWITWWVNKLNTWNIRPDQLGLLLEDEPRENNAPASSDLIIAYARVIRAAQPQVVVWEDPTWREPWKAPPELFTLCTALCPALPEWIENGKPFVDFYLRQRDEGRQLWFYACRGPVKLLDPYSYDRLQEWFCWENGALGSCFWSFSDNAGASSWNQYFAKGVGDYSPMFLDDKTVTPGKHMEAIREGVEDYEYLRMLRDRVAELESAGKKGESLDAARKLLASAADRVTACVTKETAAEYSARTGVRVVRSSDGPVFAHEWAAPKDRSVADAVRVEVLEALMRLRDL